MSFKTTMPADSSHHHLPLLSELVGLYNLAVTGLGFTQYTWSDHFFLVMWSVTHRWMKTILFYVFYICVTGLGKIPG